MVEIHARTLDRNGDEMNECDDVPRYKKKAKRKTRPKANHKHEFVNCVFEYNEIELDQAHGFVQKPELSIGMYCPVCGKIGTMIDRAYTNDINFWPSKQDFRTKFWNDDARREFDENTRTLPFFRIDKFFAKYIENYRGIV